MNPAKMTSKQKKDHYGKLNKRFDARCDELVKIGFKQDTLTSEEFKITISVFTRKAWLVSGGVQTITAQTIMHADDLVWADQMDRING